MPKRGGRKKFSTPEEIEQQRKEMERLALGPTDENGVPALNGEGAVDPSLAGSSSNQKEGSGSSSEEEDENGEMRAKGVSHLIAVQNPNYVKTKSARKLTEVEASVSSTSGGAKALRPVLSRREREEIEAQRLAAEAEEALIKQEMQTLELVRYEREKEKAKAEAEKKAKEGDRLKKAADMQAKMQQKLLNKQNKGRKVNQQKLDQQKLEANKTSGVKGSTKDEKTKQIKDEKEVKNSVKPQKKQENSISAGDAKATKQDSSDEEIHAAGKNVEDSINLELKETEREVNENWDDSDDDEIAFG